MAGTAGTPCAKHARGGSDPPENGPRLHSRAFGEVAPQNFPCRKAERPWRASAPARGRPVKYPLPDAIPDTPEGVGGTVFGSKPKKDGLYFQDRPSARRRK